MKHSASVLTALLLSAAVCTMGAEKADFKREVQPILRANCYGCHGPSQQKNGFRLDRRKDAMRGGTVSMIGPGNAAGSRMYLRLIGNDYGMQMPPTGALNPRQIEIIRNWIDQGAAWPDDVSGDVPPAPPDPKATALMQSIRDGNAQAVTKALAADRGVLRRKGPGGSTPLMYAALYGDAAMVGQFLQAGADPQAANDAGATALMWAAGDVQKTRLLLDAGANVNAHSDAGRTPLLIASGRANNAAVVKLLLDRGANPNAESPGLLFPMTPLAEATSTGDAALIGMLLDGGADPKAAGIGPGFLALATGCDKCRDIFVKAPIATPLAVMLAPPLGIGNHIPSLLEMGADANAKAPDGSPLIVQAASNDVIPVAADIVKALIAHGADVNAKDPFGATALDVARRRGDTPLVNVLLKAGAKPSAAPIPDPGPKPAASPRDAIARSLPLLQKTDASFLQKSGCVSCHNDSLPALVVSSARAAKLPVDEQMAATTLGAIGAYVDSWRERVIQGIGIPGNADTMSLLLVGMAAEKYPPSPTTDAMAAFLKEEQLPNGMWPVFGHRPPIEVSPLVTTVQSARALQVYAPKTQRADYQKAIDRANSWIAQAQPQDTQERVFQLLGLKWAGADRGRIEQGARALVKEQRPDGGWSELAGMTSDPYATGQALYALSESGAIAASDAVYQRGVRFLMNSQAADGSWHVRSRAARIQPYFESGFPYGHDQWISAAATSWATLALIPAAR